LKKFLPLLIPYTLYLVPFFSSAQDSSSTGKFFFRTSVNGAYILSYLTDERDILIAPIHWDNKNLDRAVAVIGATALVMTFDEPIKQFFQKNRSPLSDNLSKYGFEPIGSGVYTIGIVGLLYLEGLAFKNRRNRIAGLNSGKAVFLAGLTVEIPKLLFERHRPFESPNNPYQFDGPGEKGKFSSFPSGHTIVAFSLATVIADEYRDIKWIPPLAYTLAGLVGLSRLNDNKHWASDVVMGAALGYGIGKLVGRKHRMGKK